MLVGSNDGAIDKVDFPVDASFGICFGLNGGKDLVTYPLSAPAVEPAVDRAPGTVPLGHVPPRSTGFELPEDAVDDPPVILGWPAGLGLLRWKKRL